MACYADSVQVYRPPAAEPVLHGREAFADHYATRRFNLPTLHAELLNRMVMGNKVVDHERIVGLSDTPAEVVVVYEVVDGLIQSVFYFSPA